MPPRNGLTPPGVTDSDYFEIAVLVRDAIDLLIEQRKNPDCDSVMATIARCGMLPAEQLAVVQLITEELFSREIH